MFSSKKEFKQIYQQRLIEKYGNTVEEAHPTELFDILGEMVRDYAGLYWRDTRKTVFDKGNISIHQSYPFAQN